MTFFSIAFSLFLLMDSIGNIPLYISFLKKIPEKRQRIIIFREMLIALVVIILFAFLGDGLMNFLNIAQDTIQIAGGIILFVICLKMIFPPNETPTESIPHDIEPFIVPLAIPFVAGPAVLAAVMIYSRQELSPWETIGAVCIAWVPSLLILLGGSYLQKILGPRVITALERLMGLILILVAVQMFLTGLASFAIHQQI